MRVKFDTPGQFVWHCHIVEHEDNEMMRPYRVGRPAGPTGLIGARAVAATAGYAQPWLFSPQLSRRALRSESRCPGKPSR